MESYNPNITPAPDAWLALDEGERINLVAAYHIENNIPLESVQAHASLHAAVENQLAEGVPEVRAAFKKLKLKKVKRHDAIHALAGALALVFYNLNQKEIPANYDANKAYFKELKKLKASDWKR